MIIIVEIAAVITSVHISLEDTVTAIAIPPVLAGPAI